jgi:hypothetical protein
VGKSTLPEFLEAWRLGKNFVTNGPMVFLSADDNRGPGETITLPKVGGIVNLKAVATYDQPLSSLEIVANGEVVGRSDVPSSAVSAELALHLEVKQGTWIAARATAEDRLLSDQELSRYRRESAEHRGEEPTRLRFGHTSPIYVTVAGKSARVAHSIREARQMIEAFRRFTNTDGSERWNSEILDALPAALQKLDLP